MQRTILAAAVAVLLASVARAQDAPTVHVGLSGGVAVPTSHAIDDGPGAPHTLASKLGFGIAGHVAVEIPLSSTSLRGDVGYLGFEGRSRPDGAGGASRADLGIFMATANVLVEPEDSHAVTPYAIGGLGAYRVRQILRTTDGSLEDTRTRVGINGGAGIRFELGGLHTFLEARWHYVFDDQTCGLADSCFSRPATSLVPVTFGVMF